MIVHNRVSTQYLHCNGVTIFDASMFVDAPPVGVTVVSKPHGNVFVGIMLWTVIMSIIPSVVLT
jgi:hypothetical protein